MGYREESGVAVLEPTGTDYGIALKQRVRRFSPDILKEMGRDVPKKEAYEREANGE